MTKPFTHSASPQSALRRVCKVLTMISAVSAYSAVNCFAGPASSPSSARFRAPDPPRARLLVVITVDQLLPSYLERWPGQLAGGLGRLAAEGAVFTNAFQDHALTETAPGHAAVLSGRWPRHTGIYSNAEGVGDSAAPLLEVRGPGASPRRFQGTALFDWLQATDPAVRALSVSRKDRGAILPVGRARQHVYWYQAGIFTTSRYYADSLPRWVREFNARRIPFRAAGQALGLLLPETAYAEPDSAPWENGGRDVTFPHRLPADSQRAASAFAGTPWIDSLTLAFALAGVDALGLGTRSPSLRPPSPDRGRGTGGEAPDRGRGTGGEAQRAGGAVPDLLAVSLSATDAIGHAFGPDSREVHDQVLRLDRYLGWFLDELTARYGGDGLIVVLTADHGVTPYPAASRARGIAAHDVRIDTLLAAVNRKLDAAYRSLHDPEQWLSHDGGMIMLRDNARLGAAGIDLDSVWTALAARLTRVAGVARVDRPTAFARADTSADAIARRWLHHLPADAAAPLVVSLREPSAWAAAFAQHGQPTDADAHVPVIFWGPGFRPGRYPERAATVDIAPTLARRLDLEPPPGLDGRVLTAALAQER